MPDLNFVIEQQQQDQWCWAAVAISITRFCGDQRWQQQCDLVNEVLAPVRDDDDCCQNGTSNNCNMPWDLKTVLHDAGHLAPPVRGVVTFDEINREIATHKKPIAIRLRLADLMTAHFVVIAGCAEADDGTQLVKVADPSQSTGKMTTIHYPDLLNDYRPGAIWDQSYFTQ